MNARTITQVTHPAATPGAQVPIVPTAEVPAPIPAAEPNQAEESTRDVGIKLKNRQHENILYYINITLVPPD